MVTRCGISSATATEQPERLGADHIHRWHFWPLAGDRMLATLMLTVSRLTLHALSLSPINFSPVPGAASRARSLVCRNHETGCPK